LVSRPKETIAAKELKNKLFQIISGPKGMERIEEGQKTTG
jgi:hypothetical protein